MMEYHREQFEQYAAQLGKKDFELDEFGNYRNPFIQEPWDYWRASRDALAALAPSDAAQALLTSEARSHLLDAAKLIEKHHPACGYAARAIHTVLAAPVAAQAPLTDERAAIRALQRLENACQSRAALLTSEAYLAAETIPGMREALYELDDARKEANQVLRAAPFAAQAPKLIGDGANTPWRVVNHPQAGGGLAFHRPFVLQREETGCTVCYAPDGRLKRWKSETEAQRVCNRLNTGLLAAPFAPAVAAPFQQRVQPWMLECFGAEIAADRMERNHRFFEEATELVQACGMSASEAHQLVDYTFGRPVGEPLQEVGGVMVTLAALCLANGLDMHAAGETELARISVSETVAKIRAKQAAKPKHSPLPKAIAKLDERMSDAAHDVLAERARQVSVEGWTAAHDEKYRDHEMSCAAGCYAMYTLAYPAGDPPPAWPWATDWWKPTTHRRNLIKAGALILAEIERIDRAGASDAV
ncbi:hypothetical protein [Paraburkholderia tagetis]|uniref:Uncharacterized protein n=1 Tax=Paraburkholderia tagetis TaxID=2913261 RepID=A0A9X1RL95_9BURK|nr:hypothetical protein [Paraburkholderia tagetis]MCG5072224.1 hypothetical protein [Paraburkholderia tagetis]